MLRNILIASLVLTALAPALWAEPTPMPESHLLLPFFEVSLSGQARMTLFSIVNVADDDLALTATVYTNWAIPVLEVELVVRSKESLSINLRDWIVSGRLAGGETVCPSGESDCLDLIHIRDVLAGRPSPVTQLYYGSELEEGVATGFVTIEADNGFLPESDSLWGDYFYTDPTENFAQGQRLVRLEPNLSCADLCQRHTIRFLEGGGFSGGTKLTVWNWDGTPHEPSEFPVPPFSLGKGNIDVYSQDGDLVEVIPHLSLLPVQTIEVSDLNIRQPFGWFDMTTFNLSSIAGYYRALQRFSVGVPSWCMACDPCNANGPCYEPGDPSCGAPQCVSALISVAGDTRGEVGEDFALTYTVAGSPPYDVTVTDLPAGLVRNGNTIYGIPTQPGHFQIFAANDCGNDQLVVHIDPNAPEAFLTLIKQVVNDDGGSAEVSDFPLFVDGQQVTSGERVRFAPGAHTASEQNLAGYAAGSWSGDCAANGQVNLAANDDKTCVIVNDDMPARLTLIKQVINDDGGTATPGDFPLFANGQQLTTGVARKLPPGCYTASEQNLPGYTPGAWSGDCAPNGAVCLSLGDDKTCVITNDDTGSGGDPIAHLTLIKQVINDDGGSAKVSDFRLFVNSQQVTSSVAVELAPGSYIASEQNLPGYAAGTWGGDCAANGSVSLADGDNKVCEITNDDQPASITLVKQVINDDGGTAQPNDFGLAVGGHAATSGVAVQLAPGTYAASEQNRPGYTAGTWGGDCAANGSVSLALGEHKVCEITNDDQPASITLVKHVVNDDGGTAQPNDFGLAVGGHAATSGVAVPLAPGTYAASEQNLPGYTAGTWGGDCAADGSVSLALGEHKVCEITNDDQPASITLVKHVVNDDGGAAQVADFALYISGQQVTSGVAVELAPGTYTASEQNLAGYTAGSWGGDCAADGSVTVALGEHKVCEITNDDEPQCDPTPTFAVWDGQVDFNDPHRDYHHTEVSFRFRVDGEVHGEVQLFWQNGSSTYIKEHVKVDLDCDDQAFEGSIFWQSNYKAHHPGHGAKYTARLVVNGNVVASVPLN